MQKASQFQGDARERGEQLGVRDLWRHGCFEPIYRGRIAVHKDDVLGGGTLQVADQPLAVAMGAESEGFDPAPQHFAGNGG